ncbi:biogenesis of lysosome-related organelles complex 1 subunit 5-like [Anneissia japonica]|uniref:biogenesis of lysosome-related organelles complex 1 subunit 5-like n=1 Tax=Anneissia japonica TaxID=1529436 RepID=UPI00142563E2|nr:biogenesis of lysosome-related organelles complex 1 subunit 5-like [Anneissia japonica]
MENTLKDTGEIHARLLDHRPVIQGEIRYFIKEFESRRSNREMKRLKKIQEHTNDINDRVLPQCEDFMETHLNCMQETMLGTIKMCERIATAEERSMQLGGQQESLKENRMRRDKEWKAFTEKLSEEQAAIDTKHQIRVNELEDQYSKMKILISK